MVTYHIRSERVFSGRDQMSGQPSVVQSLCSLLPFLLTLKALEQLIISFLTIFCFFLLSWGVDQLLLLLLVEKLRLCDLKQLIESTSKRDGGIVGDFMHRDCKVAGKEKQPHYARLLLYTLRIQCVSFEPCQNKFKGCANTGV